MSTAAAAAAPERPSRSDGVGGAGLLFEQRPPYALGVPGWLFWGIWTAGTSFAFGVAARRYARFGTTRRNRRGVLAPKMTKVGSQIELAMWGLFALGGFVYGLVYLLN